MRKKLRDARGETLVEVLASVLIGALSVALLFTAVMASVNMDRNAQKTDEAFYGNFNKAEGQAPAAEVTPNVPDENGKIIVPSGTKVTVDNTDSTVIATPTPVDVDFYGGEGALSYKLSP